MTMVSEVLTELELFIDGRFEGSSTGASYESEDPYACRSWAVERDARALAEVETPDNGKPCRDANAQAAYIADWLRYFAGHADKIEGRAFQEAPPNLHVYSIQHPIGPVAAILPWNAALILLAFKLAPALAAGCAFVAKPSEFTPASTLAFGACVEETGFPPGVFNVVVGQSRQAGAHLVSHPGVDKVAFTGSTRTGVAVVQAALGHLAAVTLGLGGKSSQIVFADADLDQATNGVVAGVFATSGQFWTAGSWGARTPRRLPRVRRATRRAGSADQDWRSQLPDHRHRADLDGSAVHAGRRNPVLGGRRWCAGVTLRRRHKFAEQTNSRERGACMPP